MARRAVSIAVAAALIVGLMAVVVPDRATVPPDVPVPQPAPARGSATPFPTNGAAVPQRVRADAARTSCRGRVVAAEDGSPLAHCVVIAGDRYIQTGADGCFELELPTGGAPFEVRVQSDTRVTVARVVDPRELAAGIGDVPLRRGAVVGGVVHDTTHRTLGDVIVRLRCREPLPRGDAWVEHWPLAAVTGSDGAFVFGEPLPPGVAFVQCEGAPPLAGDPAVALTAGDQHLALVCRATASSDWIEGTVHDANGAPVAGAIVQATPTPGVLGPAAVRTNEHGEFRLCRGDAAAVPVSLVATSLAADRCSPRSDPIEWGARDVALELAAGGALPVLVVDAATGAPIDDFVVQCTRTAGVRGHAAERRRGRPGAGGTKWLDGVAPGPGALIVWPDDERWLPCLPHPFDHDGNGAVVRVELARAVPFPVRVQTASGRPLAGVHVELLLPGSSDVVRDLDRLLDVGRAHDTIHVRLARAITGADGVAALRWHADARPLLLRVHGDGTSAHAEHGVHVDAEGRVMIVPDAARLHVRLRGAATGGSRLVLRGDGGAQVPLAWASPLELDAAGGVVADVPAGRWSVFVRRSLASAVWLDAPGPVATVVLQPGERRTLDVDVAGALAPGSVAGSAFVDGKPAATVVLLCGEPDAAGGARAVHTIERGADARGAFVFGELPAGDYTLRVYVPCSGMQVAVSVGGWLRVAPGERLAVAPIEITTAPVRVRARGAVRAGDLLELSGPPGQALLGAFDASGEAAFDRVPVATYRLRLRRGDEPQELGSLAVTGGAPVVHAVDVR